MAIFIEGVARTFSYTQVTNDRLILPGAFRAGPVDPKRVAMLLDHEDDQVCGEWTAINISPSRIRVAGVLRPVGRNSAFGRIVHAVRQGDLRGLSIKYKNIRSHRSACGHKIVEAAELIEISLCTNPAHTLHRFKPTWM